ncbi:TIGR01457 family HAD-type hydrolase [Salisediminibacterium beveridgei]|uniref:Acid sugar phosphatase n=1 Tax=Salisediminibacterium beveridgei TaxID=632773 RepID=A0A1D7QSQ0_9BACI|nr:TIGR01457 family HAD-type hydrolase [Salisediminibacterium beveridgei]AOM82028.1 putative hydrolase yutF [Salisediminibacterium beveridgei]
MNQPKSYKGYLIDLDGTMYRGSEKIPAASRFVKKLIEQDIPYLFVTNNSSRTPAQVAEKLVSMDIPATEQHVFTTSMATANYLHEQYGQAGVYMIGEEGLSHALNEKGITLVDEEAKSVVIGLDREVTYEKLTKACLNIRNGAAFLSTNADKAIPTEQGLLPGNGSLTSVMTVSTGVEPLFIGKPESIIVDQALAVLGVDKADTVMVGDNYDTDIMAGINAEMDTLMVFTGVTPKEEMADKAVQPTFAVDSLDEWQIV